MKGPVNDVELLSRAIEALRNTTGLSIITTSFNQGGPDGGYDATLRIGIGNFQTEYAALIKRYITNEMVGALASDLRRTSRKAVLVTQHITTNQADKLKNLNVAFFDTAGNAFLADLPLFVFITGRRSNYAESKVKTTRAFSPSGLRTVFALLCNPGLEREAYRDIGAAAAVSHGTVERVLDGLKTERYLADMGSRGRELTNKEGLLKRWVEAYPQQLRPKLFISRYRAKEKDWWQQAQLAEFASYWGGEVAAAKMTAHLRPELITIYAPTASPALQVKFGLRRDPQGDIEILKTFWAFTTESNNREIVPPLLVYADLMASGDDRNIETAEIIYETQISRLIRATTPL